MSILHELRSVDLRACSHLNGWSSHQLVRVPFVVVSRLGDGVAWYVLMLLLPLAYGVEGLRISAVMAVAGLLTLVLYKVIKSRTSRLRPFLAESHIHARTHTLDRYSFPSGHTMHAVTFTLIATASFPALGIVLWPFTVLIAVSRPVLGLHYPSDVVVGAILGAMVASAALALPI